MSRRTRSALWAFALSAALSVVLTACQIMTVPGVSTIPGAGYSTMDSDNVALRTGLTIAAAPLPREASYVPFRCSYQASLKPLGGEASRTQPLVATTRVRDRLLVTITEGTNVSTALIGHDGHLFDFNLARFLGGRRVDAGNYGQVASAEAQRLERAEGQTIHVLNEFTIIFPHFANRRPTPGDVTSEIIDESRKVWGQYIYRGIALHNGLQVAVFDLTATAASSGTPVIVGFSLVDPTTMAPVLTILNTSSTLRFERMSCR